MTSISALTCDVPPRCARHAKRSSVSNYTLMRREVWISSNSALQGIVNHSHHTFSYATKTAPVFSKSLRHVAAMFSQVYEVVKRSMAHRFCQQNLLSCPQSHGCQEEDV